MARKMSRKQIAIFGTARQKAALKRGRSRSRPRRSPRRRRTKKVRTMARRRSRRFGGRSKKAQPSILDMAAHANTAIQLAEPFIPAAQAAMNGDIPGAIAAAKPALAEASSPRNIAQIAVPYAVRGFAKKALRMFGAKNPQVFGRRLW